MRAQRMIGSGRAMAAVGGLSLCVGAAPLDPLRFDLVCDLRGRVVADPQPSYTGTYPANVRKWQHEAREIVDLETMKYCDPGICETFGPDPIVRVEADRIVFADQPGFTRFVRHDGWFKSRLVDGKRVRVTTGRCRREPFSGFPAIQDGDKRTSKRSNGKG